MTETPLVDITLTNLTNTEIAAGTTVLVPGQVLTIHHPSYIGMTWEALREFALKSKNSTKLLVDIKVKTGGGPGPGPGPDDGGDSTLIVNTAAELDALDPTKLRKGMLAVVTDEVGQEGGGLYQLIDLTLDAEIPATWQPFNFPPAAGDAISEINARISVLEISQGDGVPGVANYADIATLFPSPTAGQQVDVLTDPDPAKVGRWGYIGGVWVKSEDRVTGLASETANYRAAGDPIRPAIDADLDWAWNIVDGQGKVAAGVLNDGTFMAAVVGGIEAIDVGDTALGPSSKTAGYAWSIEDAAGNVALGVRSDGKVDVGAFGKPIPARPDRFGGAFSHQINYINGAGQSLAYGASGAITTAQEYDNTKFPYKATAPTAFLPAFRTDGEDPTMGTMGHIKELISEENGIAWQANDYQLCCTNNAVSANNIDQLSPGGSSGAYEACISQVTAGAAIAASMGKSFAFRAVTWTQGEANAGMAKATYKAKQIALAESFNSDGKAATGQTQDVAFITYQVASNTDRAVAVAQWEAANEHPLIYLATPMYFMDYVDFQHINNVSSKWLGGYYGLVYKRVVIDGKPWEPLQPTTVQIVGNNIDITFNKGGLTFDTVTMPPQSNHGFSVVNGGGAAQTISSVSILPGNRVRIALSSPPAAGWKVRYGHNSVTGKAPFVGGGGNLRDNQGAVIKYIGKPMHNWCVIFDWEV